MRPLCLGVLLGILISGPTICRAENPQPPAGPTAVRTWSDTTGRFHTEGVLLGGDRTQVRLQKVKGSVITVEVARLSEQDREFVANFMKSRSAAADKSSGEASSSTHSVASGDGSPADWISNLATGWSSSAEPSTGNAVAVASIGRLVLQAAPPMPENVVYVRLSRKFLERMAWHDINQRAAVKDNVLGYNVVGLSKTIGSTDFELQPSDQFGLAEIHLFGTTTYNTVADAGPIQVHTSGVTRFASAKAFRFDETGIHFGPAATNAETSSRVTGVQTSLPGLRGRIALRVGGRRAAESRAEAAAITAEHTKRQVSEGFDASSNAEIADLWKTIEAETTSLPAEDPLRQCSWHVSSTKDALQIVLLESPSDHGRRVPAPSPIFADAEVEVQVHVAMVRRAVVDVQLQKLLQPISLRLAAASASGSRPSNPPTIRWSSDQNWLSLSWSAEHPAEPAQPSAAILANGGE
jgi:hypothetical protein